MAQTNPTQLATAAPEEPPLTRVAMHAPITRGERIADSAAAVVGSWRFIIVQTILVVIWVVLNVLAWGLQVRLFVLKSRVSISCG
jgi:uncharacterized membrane protein